jgi:hypothetical protein
MPLTEFAEFDRRPILVAIAGPNGAGKTTFYHRQNVWPCAYRRAAMTFQTTNCGRVFLDHSPIFRLPSFSYPMS